MDAEILIPITFFALIFSIFYLHYTTRHKERAMLIEKGIDASIFYTSDRKTAPVWKILILNIALLMMGIGLGIALSIFFRVNANIATDALEPACIFLMAGIGLFIGYYMTKKM